MDEPKAPSEAQRRKVQERRGEGCVSSPVCGFGVYARKIFEILRANVYILVPFWSNLTANKVRLKATPLCLALQGNNIQQKATENRAMPLAVHVDTYRILQRDGTIFLPQHNFPV